MENPSTQSEQHGTTNYIILMSNKEYYTANNLLLLTFLVDYFINVHFIMYMFTPRV